MVFIGYSDEYPCGRVSVDSGFLHDFVLAKLTTISIKVNCIFPGIEVLVQGFGWHICGLTRAFCMEEMTNFAFFQALEAVKAADWPSQLVTPLDPADKAQIVTDYLEGIYGKTLSADQKDMIISAEQTNNPLYLKALLDEVPHNIITYLALSCLQHPENV